MVLIEDMAEVEVILEEVAFMEGIIPLEEMKIGTEIERIVGPGDNQNQEREK